MGVLILFIIVGIVILAVVIAEKTSPVNLGKAGEDEVSFILRSLPKDYLVLNNAIIPDQGIKSTSTKKYTTQIDHVVVSPYGIFVIETKNYSGWIFGSEKSKKWKETFKTTEGRFFYNPIKQNWGHIYALADHLNLCTVVFKPVVVFSNNCELKVETTTPVIYMSQLKAHILSYTQEIIPRMDVPLIYDRLSKINLVGEEIETKHISSIGERKTVKETTLNEQKCPLCGGTLKLRKGRYGAFYGCSNYPKCRYTINVRQ